MPDLTPLISHWGHLAIFLFVLLGNLGLPVPAAPALCPGASAGQSETGGRVAGRHPPDALPYGRPPRDQSLRPRR
jgi:hypothetical protein